MVFAFFPILATAQELPEPPTSVVVKAGRLLDVSKGRTSRTLPCGLKVSVSKRLAGPSDVEPHAPERRKTNRPRTRHGLARIDRLPHSHYGANRNTDDGYVLALATKSQAFSCAPRAFDARVTLNAGFTTISDVESEGAGYADVALRGAIQQGIADPPLRNA